MRQLGIDYQQLALRSIDKKLKKMADSFNNFSKSII